VQAERVPGAAVCEAARVSMTGSVEPAMPATPAMPAAPPFAWAVGIEDSFIAQPHGRTRRVLDEYALVGHYEHWRADLDAVASVGVRWIRYGLPWYRVNPAPGVFDWTWSDAVLPYLVEHLGIAPIVDLMHYGCPTWLAGEFLNPDYPARVAEYGAAVAARYGHLVRDWTPLNEPIVNADRCGRFGSWPPYARGWSGFARIVVALARGMSLTAIAIRSLQTDPRFVMVEATEHPLPVPGFEPYAAWMWQRQFLPTDLLLGRVDPAHPFATWLLEQGATEADLAWLVANPGTVHTLGVNFYPAWSAARYALPIGSRDAGLEPRRRGYRSGPAELERIIRAWHERYRLPVMVTETSDIGSVERRAAWMDASIAMARRLRAGAFPLVGYTWFPVLPHYHWDYRHGRRGPLAFRAQMGLWDFSATDDGRPYVETSLADRYRAHVAAAI